VKIELKPIGVVRSPYRSKEDGLHGVSSTVCEIEVSKEFEKGSKDVERFSHLILLWIFQSLKVIRFM
jgi:tRNA (Thr-GGU) A37 N-methylase